MKLIITIIFLILTTHFTKAATIILQTKITMQTQVKIILMCKWVKKQQCKIRHNSKIFHLFKKWVNRYQDYISRIAFLIILLWKIVSKICKMNKIKAKITLKSTQKVIIQIHNLLSRILLTLLLKMKMIMKYALIVIENFLQVACSFI